LHGNGIFDGVCLGTKKMPFIWELPHCPPGGWPGRGARGPVGRRIAGRAMVAVKFFQRF